jgi:site-specific recombinase XerD
MGDFSTIADWLRWLHAQGYSDATIRLYSYGTFRLLSEQVQGDLGTITEAHVTAFLSSLGTRATARSQYFRGIRSLCSYLARHGVLPSDPTIGLRLRKPRHRPPVRLDAEELTRYLVAAAWRHPRRAWTLMLVYGLGARRSEVAGIMPSDVLGDEVILHGKGGKQRSVGLGPLATAALEELRPWWNGTVLGGIDPQTITAWAHQAAVDSGLYGKVQRRTAHVLRASFISYLLDQGVPIHVVRDLAGHENIATTSGYAVSLSQDRRRAVELV